MTEAKLRADHSKQYRQQYRSARKKILQSQDICALCGRPVDKTLKAPDPMSATVDHIIPLNKGGHPSDIQNLQLAHWICNRMKSDKLTADPRLTQAKAQSEKVYQTCDWKNL